MADMNDPRYQEILRLQELIEQQDELVKSRAAQLEKTPTISIAPDGGQMEGDLRPNTPKIDAGQSKNLSELNDLINQQTQIQKELYFEQVKQEPVEELVTNPEELENPTENYSEEFGKQDLINSYKAQLGSSYTDQQILDYASFVNPQQYNAVMGGIESDSDEEDSPSFLEITKNAWKTAWENEAVTQDYYVPAFKLNTFDMYGLAPAKIDSELKEILKKTPEYKNASDSELDLAVVKFKENGLKNEELINQLLVDGKNKLDESFKNNSEAIAVSNYLQDSDGWLFDKNGKWYAGKWIANSAVSGVVSVYNSRLWALPGMITSTAGKAAMVSPVPGGRAVGSGLMLAGGAMEYAGQMYYGYNMEGSSFMAESFHELTTDQRLTPEQFQRDIKEKKELFRNQMDENGNKPSYTQQIAMLDRYILNEYVQKDGSMIKVGLPYEDAIEGVKIATSYAAPVSSVIESIDVFARRTTGGIGLKGPLQAKMFGNFSKKASDILRTTPIIKNWKDLRKIDPNSSRVKVAGNSIFDVVIGKGQDNIAEGVEEVLQLASSNLFQVTGMGEDDFKIGVGQVFSDRWDWKQARESFAGGYFGSKLFNAGINFTKLGFDATGIMNSIKKKPVGLQFKENAESGLFSEEVDGNFQIFQGISSIDETTNEVVFDRIDAELKDPISGKSMSSVYTNKNEAEEVVNRLNLERRVTNEKIIAGLNQWMYKSVAVVEKSEPQQIGEIKPSITWKENRKGYVVEIDGVEVGFTKDKPLNKKQERLYQNSKEKAFAEAKKLGNQKMSEKVSPAAKKEKKQPWSVNVYTSDGKLKSKNGVFESRGDAKVKASNLNKDILNVTSIIDKHGLDNINKITEKVKNKINRIKDVNEDSNNINGLPYIKKGNKNIPAENVARVLIKGYMVGTKRKDTNDMVEIAKNEEDLHALIRENKLDENPQILKDVLDTYPDLFTEENIPVDDFIDNFKTDFEDYKEYLNEDNIGKSSTLIKDLNIVEKSSVEALMGDNVVEEGPTVEEEEIITKGNTGLFKTPVLKPVVKKEEEAPEVEEYLNVQDRVSFPSAPSRKEAHAIVDGKKVPLTENQKDRLEKIAKQKGSSANLVKGFADADIRELALELVKQEEKKPAPKKPTKKAPKLKTKDIVNEIIKNDLLKGMKNLYDKGVTVKELREAFKDESLQIKIGEMIWWTQEVAIQEPELEFEIIPFLELVSPYIAKNYKISIGWDYLKPSDPARIKATKIIDNFIDGKEPKWPSVKDNKFTTVPDWVRNPNRLGNEYTGEYTEGQLGVLSDAKVLTELAISQGFMGPKLVDFLIKKFEKFGKTITKKEKKDLNKFSETFNTKDPESLNKFAKALQKIMAISGEKFTNEIMEEVKRLELESVDNTVSGKIEKILSEYKGQSLTIKYEKYDKPFEVTLEDIRFLNISTSETFNKDLNKFVDDIETREYPSPIGKTNTGKEVPFFYGEIEDGPPALIEKLKEIYSLKEVVDKPQNKVNNITKSKSTSIVANREDNLVLNKGQVSALNFLDKNTLTKDFPLGKFESIISGYAGTGKTTIIENIIRQAHSRGYKINVVAPTNKAVLVLKDKGTDFTKQVANYQTIHKLLYGEPDNMGVFKPAFKYGPGELIIVDESSMVDKSMYKDLQALVINKGGKIIFFGDGFQLPPVGSDPKILDRADMVLKEVMRQGLKSKILSYATFIRNRAIQSRFEPILPLGSKKDVTMSKDIFQDYKQSLLNKDDSILITGSNASRVSYNRQSRYSIYGEESNKKVVMPQEKVISIANSKVKVNGETFKLENPDVLGTYDVQYEGWSKKTREKILINAKAHLIRDGKYEYLLFPNTEESSIYHQSIEQMTIPKGLWPKEGQGMSKNTTIITYGYAITGHKSQGSQWNNVYIDTSIFFKGENAARWLYTTVTRAAKKLYLKDNAYGKTSWNDIDFLAAQSAEKKFQLSRGVAIPQSPANQAKTKKYVKMMFDKFEGKIPYEFINDTEMRNETGNIVSAYYSPKNKKVVINLAYARPETGFHEYMHPFIIEMRKFNPKLFNNILYEILESNDGKKLFKDIADIYTSNEYNSRLNSELSEMIDNSDGIENISADELYKTLLSNDDKQFTISDELIAFAVSEKALDYVPKDNAFKRVVKKILDYVRHKLFGPTWVASIYAKTMDENTSLNDIAKLLANSNRKFGLEKVDKKLVNSQYDFLVDNKRKFILHTDKKIEITDTKEKDATWLNSFYTSIWEDAGAVGYTKKEDFAAVLIPLLGNELTSSFSIWYRRKFNSKKIKISNDFIGKDSLYDIAKNKIDNNHDMLKNIRDNGVGTDERTVTPSSLFYLNAFGISLYKSQLNRIVKIAKNIERSGGKYEDWKKAIFKKGEPLENQRVDMAKWQNNSLKRFHGQLLSSGTTNRGDALQEMTNYELLVQQIGYEDQASYKFNFNVKGPEKKYREREFSFEEGKYIYGQKKGNTGFQKKTLFDHITEESGLFGFLSGSDMKKIRFMKDDMGLPILDAFGKEISNITSYYGFLSQREIESLDKHLINKKGLTIAFSRGDSDKIAITRITEDAIKHAKDKKSVTAYLKNEFPNYMSKKQAQGLWKDITSKSSLKERAAIISAHEAMKKVWPRYALDTKGPANVYKRLKIPFTPTTVVKDMEPLRVFKFDPHKVKFQYKNNEPYSPIQLGEYIGDGETPTSANAFKKFNDSHGLVADIAKTVHYLTSGDNTYALKHQHFVPTRDWKIVNNKGTLFKIDDKRNIYLGSAHPNYVEGGNNYVDMIGTYNEIKIGTEEGGIFSETDELYVPGASVGFIKYEENMPAHAKHPQQWYNHIDDPKILKHFSDTYMPIVENKLRNAIRIAIDTKNSTSAEKISQLLEALQGKDEMGRYPVLLELARLGAGGHLQTAKIVDKLVQSKLVEPALQLDGFNGSTYNIAMDVTNTLEEGEIGISRKKAKTVLDKFKEANPKIKSIKNVSNEEINAWLLNNPVYAMVTRFPVPHAGGALMARVKMIHDRKGVVSMNVYDVKVRLEGDNDGDHVEIEFLPSDEMTKDFRNYLDKLKVKALDLSKFVNENIKDNIFTSEGRANLIAKLTAGARAIGEVANTQAAYGSMNQVFKSFRKFGYPNKPENNIVIKGKDEKIRLNIYYDNKMGWEGTVSEYLRLYLQAAVDNGKYGLLGQWGYNRDEFVSKLFRMENGKEISVEMFKDIVSPAFQLHLEANKIRNGQDFYIGKYSFSDVLSKSKKYLSYVTNRTGYLNSLDVDVELIKSDRWENVKFPEGERAVKITAYNPTPIELIATAPARIFDEMTSEPKYNLFSLDGSPYIISIDLHQNSHREAMNSMDILKEEYFESAFIEDNVENNLAGRLAFIQDGKDYANKMGTRLEELIEQYVNIGPQSMDYNENFLEWIEKYDSEFKELNRTSRLAATYTYLEGFKNLNTKKITNISGTHLPAVSDSPGQPTMLEADIIKEYFKIYNKNIKDKKNLGSLANFNYRPLKNIAIGLCK